MILFGNNAAAITRDSYVLSPICVCHSLAEPLMDRISMAIQRPTHRTIDRMEWMEWMRLLGGLAWPTETNKFLISFPLQIDSTGLSVTGPPSGWWLSPKRPIPQHWLALPHKSFGNFSKRLPLNANHRDWLINGMLTVQSTPSIGFAAVNFRCGYLLSEF